ncbi:MAG: hypothetical protein CXX80_06035 [Methanobacteriota archaeon]|nr:MAG: hypothetical protein CXX80_06035 [Euryarchaeota archaeon]
MPLSNAEAQKISTATGKKIEEFTKPLSATGGILELANNPATQACVFLATDSPELDAEGICTIHEIRPEGCQIYPVILDQKDAAWMDIICPHTAEFDPPTEKLRLALIELDRLINAEAETRD